MIIFLYGPDTYRAQRKIKEIIERYQKVHKSGLNLKYFEKKFNFQDFKTEIETSSMFHEKKLCILKNIFSDQTFQEEFLRNGKEIVNSDNIVLIYEEGGIEPSRKKRLPEKAPKGQVFNKGDKKNPLFNFLKEKAKTQEFNLLEGQQLRNWVKREAGRYGVKIEPEALELLIRYVGNDLWQMENEIKKLINYSRRQAIRIQDVKSLVSPQIETDIFKTIDAISSGNKKLAIRLIHQHLEKDSSPLYLLSMINFQFRNILTVKGLLNKYSSLDGIAKILHLHPYVVKKSYFQGKRFQTEELKKIYQKIYQADLNIKTGKIEPEAALDLLITEM